MSWADRPRSGVGASLVGAIASMAVPGVGHALIGDRRRRSTFLLFTSNLAATALVITFGLRLRSRDDLVALVAQRSRMLTLAVALVVMVGTRVVTALHSAHLARPTNFGNAKLGVLGAAVGALVVAGSTPLAVGANYVWRTDQAVDQVFSDGNIVAMPTAAEPTAPDDRVTVTGTTMPGDTTPVGTTAVPGDTVAPSQPTTTAPFVGLARTNVLLLGGDAGPGRFGLRSDAMIVVSIDPASGDTAMISLPRNLRRLPFPAGTPLADRFPRGFNDLANAVYPFAENNPELVWGAVDAGAQAMKLGAAQLLGMPIQYYVLVDMAGFVDVVDALGGIDITVGQRVPSPGNPPGAKHDVPEFFEPGHQHMDGTNALAYARSRSADSDYQRMARQRCVLGAIADAATPVAVASGLGDLVSAFGSSVRTDIPRDDLPAIAELVERYRDGGALASVRTLQLTPPLVNPNRWDLVEVRALVASVVEPNGPPAATPPDPSIDPPTTPSAPPSETSPPLVTAPTRILADAC